MKSLKQLRQRSLRQLISVIALIGMVWAPLIQADNLYFVHTDHLGTPAVVTDDNQQVVWQGDKNPFGETEVTVNQIEFNVRFPGQYFDAESGLHYNYFRDYDPSLGRYVQSDPIGLRGGLNTYGYAYQNPIMHTDPTGQFVPVIIGGIIITGEMIVGLGTIGIGVTGMLCVKGMICDLPNNQFNEEVDEDTGDTCPNDSGDKDPSTPVGRRGNPLDVADGTNKPATIGGREYSGHALDRTQGRGVPPSAVEDAIANGTSSPGNQPGTTKHTGDNGVTVITNDTGKVVTVITR